MARDPAADHTTREEDDMPPKRYRDPTISTNCRAQHQMPHRPEDAHCWGCSCGCHAVAPPANFRQLVQRQRERAQTSSPGQRGEALPGLDPGEVG
jgi:hypothetical protein